MVGIVVVRIDSILAGFGEPDLADALDEAVRTARYETAERKQPVFLAFDPEAAAFTIRDRRGGVIRDIATAYAASDKVEVTLTVEAPGRGRPDRRLGSPETVEVLSLRFDPDRSAPAFTARWRGPNDLGEARYDAFSPSLWPEPTP